MDEPSTSLRWYYPAQAVCSDGVWGDRLDGWQRSSLAAFKESSAKGCAACSMILEAIHEFYPDWTSHLIEDKEILLYYGESGGPEPGRPLTEALGVYLKLPEHESKFLAHEASFQLLYQTADKHLFRPAYEGNTYNYGDDLVQSSLHIVEDTRSSQAFERVSRWLSHCLEVDDCCKVPDSQFMPKRLIYVGSPGDAEPKLHLVEPKDSTVYACLSYCWGTDLVGVLTTRVENLSTHMRHIDEAALPKSIADAVFVCRNLGISHLWVDSLCIVQNSAADWAQQSSVMGEIYARSHFTIYAQNAPSCKSSFLGPQAYGHPSWQRPAKTQVPLCLGPPSETNRLFFRTRPAKDDHATFPLNTRGWTMQEALLPNRKLFFTGSEMFWTCVGRTIRECGHISHVPRLLGRSLDGIKHALGLIHSAHYAASGRRGHRVDHASILRDWDGLVKGYSLRQLTKAEDKLAAISGLASMTRDAIAVVTGGFQDIYCAGLWESRLLHGLTWWTALGGTRPAGYKAPTWSWASIDGPVAGFMNQSPRDAGYMQRVYRDTEVRRVQCQPEEKLSPTGKLVDGFLELKGPVVRVSVAAAGPDEYIRYDAPSPVCRVWSDCHDSQTILLEKAVMAQCRGRDEAEVRSTTIPYLPPPADQPRWALRRDFADSLTDGDKTGTRAENAEYACIQLITWSRYGKGEQVGGASRRTGVGQWIPPVTCFLVLQRRAGQDDVYTRVGVGFCTAIAKWDGTPRDMRMDEPDWQFPLIRGCENKLIRVV